MGHQRQDGGNAPLSAFWRQMPPAVPCYTHAEGASADIVVERVAALKELGYRNIRVQAGGYGGGKGAQIHKPETAEGCIF